MKLTRRERFLLALLPPVAIVGGYVAFFEPALQARIDTAQTRIRTALVADAPKGAGADAATLRAQLERLEHERAVLEARRKLLPARWSVPGAHAATARGISDLFAKHRLRLESSGTPSTAAASSPSPATAALARALKDLGGADPLLWRVSAAGSWKDIVSALTELSAWTERERCALPLSFVLEPLEGQDELSLSVVLWI